MKSIPEQRSDQRWVTNRILNTGYPEFSTGPIATLVTTSSAGGDWPGANDPIALPFVVTEKSIVTQLGVGNGSAAGANFDIGIYDRSWNRKVSAGSTAMSGASTWQFVDVTDTPLDPGHYYIVLVRDDVTLNRQYIISSTIGPTVWQLFGVMDSTTDAFPLPDPLTNMVPCASFPFVPIVAVAFRAPYA